MLDDTEANIILTDFGIIRQSDAFREVMAKRFGPDWENSESKKIRKKVRKVYNVINLLSEVEYRKGNTIEEI